MTTVPPVSSGGVPAEPEPPPPQPCSLSTIADVKRWFVAVIAPDFSRTEAQQACGLSPRISLGSESYRVSLTLPPSEMCNMQNLANEYNVPKDSAREWCLNRWFSRLQPGSVRSCTVSLAATSLGSGSLALPYAFKLTGIGTGLLVLVLAMIVSSLSLQILMVGARYTNSESYSSLLKLAVRSRALSYLLDLFIVMNGIGAITCILIFEGDFIPAVFASPPWGGLGLHVERRIAVLAVALAVYPLTLPSDLSALRYTSVVVPVVLVATIAIVWSQIPKYLDDLNKTGGGIVWWNFSPKNLLQAIPIMVNAYTNQQNAVPSGNKLEQPSVARIVKATFNANLMVFALLAAMGVGGYLCWGKDTKGDFIVNFPHDNKGIWACRVMLSITVYFVIPVALFPASRSLAQLVLSTSSEVRRDIGRPLHILSSTMCLIICTAIAVVTDNIASVIGVLGGILATSVMFWFPALIYWIALWPTQPPFCRSIVLGLMLCFGICGFASVVMIFV